MNSSAPQNTVGVENVEPADADSLVLVLAELAEHETTFSERFYEIFFERRPDARPLFGAYPIAEQEEMMRETLRSLHGWLEAESWLDGNLTALGRSHWEYGVTADMYGTFVDVMIACAHEVLGDFFDGGRARALRTALDAIVEPMRRAGDEAADAASN